MSWLSPDQPRPKKPRTDNHANKVLNIIAPDANGTLAQVWVP